MEKICITTYGCSYNQADSEIMKGILSKAGYTLVESPMESQLNIINTCVVKSPTEARMVFKIKELLKLNKPLIVAGCMPKIERRLVEAIAPNASMLGPDTIQKVVYVVRETLSGRKIVLLDDLRKSRLLLPRVRKNVVISIVPIAIGCLSSCTYCCVRFARGRLLSYSASSIIEEVKNSLKDGCKEVWITSQDCGCYGMDIGSNLPTMLMKVLRIPGKFFIRLGMMNPSHVKNMLEELIEVYRSSKIFKFLHLPVQSGSDRILRLMNREYTIKEFIQIIKRFREEFPSLTFSTDVIVGFPSETNKDFQQTVSLIRRLKPDIVNLSKFGKRPLTKAAEMEQLPHEIIKRRARKLAKLIDDIRLENNEKWLGWSGEVLIDERGKNGRMLGRNFAYKSIVIDGKLGEFKRTRIVEARATFLVGK